jgi:hypothetical protein
MEENVPPGQVARDIIASRWPAMAASLHSAECTIDLQLDQTGEVPTLLANGIRLASAWQPDREAQLQCGESIAAEEHLTLFGVGMGYLPPVLLEQLPAGARLSVVPLNLGLFDRMLDLIEMSDWLAHPSVELLAAADITQLPDAFRITPPMLQLVDPQAESLRDWLMQALSDTHARAHQTSVQSTLEQNLQRNIDLHSGDKDVDYLLNEMISSQLSGDANVVVAGAGPSLDHAMDVMMQLRDTGASVIAVDAALAPLLAHGIVPDVIVSIDPLETIKRFFATDTSLLANTALVYFPVVHPDVVAGWPYRRFSAVGSHQRFLSFRKIKKSTVLFSSGSVIHPAVDIACRIGRHIHLAGVDFGYPFESTHASGVAVAADSAGVASASLTVRNYLNDEVPSQMNFISYYRDLEQFVDHQTRRGSVFRNIGHYSARMRHVSVLPVAA